MLQLVCARQDARCEAVQGARWAAACIRGAGGRHKQQHRQRQQKVGDLRAQGRRVNALGWAVGEWIQKVGDGQEGMVARANMRVGGGKERAQQGWIGWLWDETKQQWVAAYSGW